MQVRLQQTKTSIPCVNSSYPEHAQTEYFEYHEDRPKYRGSTLREPEDVDIEDRVAHIVGVRLEVPAFFFIFVIIFVIIQVFIGRDITGAPPAESNEVSASHVLGDPEVEASRQ